METENFGTVLRTARERRQISLSEVARRTKVSTNSLQLIEAGKLDDLPPEVFVRGFIRSYAQAIGIPQSEPLTLYDEALNQKRRTDEPGIPVLALQPRRTLVAQPQHEVMGDDDGQLQRRGIGLAVFVIIVLLIATITLSLFLRQQPQSGEGLSIDSLSAPSAPSEIGNAPGPTTTV